MHYSNTVDCAATSCLAFIIPGQNSLILMRIWLLLLVCALSSIQTAIADTKSLSAIQWLHAMETALKSSAFQGTLIHAGANQIDTLQVFHATFDGIEYEHVVSLDASAQEVIRDDSKIFCFNQQLRNGRVSIVRSNDRWLGLLSALHNADRYYTLNLGKQQKVVQRLAQVVNIIPRDQFRYQHKLWIDLSSSIPVKSQIIDSHGKVLEQLMFASLTVNQSIPRSLFRLPLDSKQYRWVTQKSELIPDSQQNWHLVGKPAGFEVINYMQHHHPDSEKTTHILLGDGISMVSVYINLPTITTQTRNKDFNVGAINLVTSENNGYRVTVIGEVPLQTVRLIADSVNNKSSH